MISFLASTYMFFARPRPHPTEFYGKFECETICRRRNLWRGSTLSTGQRCTHSINSELILLLLWVRHFFCTIVPRAWLFTCWRIPLCLSTLEMRLGWLRANKNAKMFVSTKRVGDGHNGLSKMFGKARTFYKKMKEPIAPTHVESPVPKKPVVHKIDTHIYEAPLIHQHSYGLYDETGYPHHYAEK